MLLYVTTRSILLQLKYCPFSMYIRGRIMRTLNIAIQRWCDGNKRKILLKVDTPRIVCYVPGYTERKAAAAGRRSRG